MISTKSSSRGQTEWGSLCAKTLTTPWFHFRWADVQFVDKNLPKKHALGSNPPELLCLWQRSQRPQKRSIIMFTSQPWNEHEMRYWDWFLHYPVAFWFLKEIKIPFFLKKGSADSQISLPTYNKLSKKLGGMFLHTQQGLLLKAANICALKYLLLGSKEVSFWNMCEFIDLPHFQKLNKRWRNHPLLFLKKWGRWYICQESLDGAFRS